MARTAIATAPISAQAVPPAPHIDSPSETGPSFPASPAALSSLAALCLGRVQTQSIGTREWPSLIHLALEHGVAPLLYLRVAGQRLPETARADLARLFRANLARNVALDRQRGAVENELRREGVPALSLKGPQLALQLHGDIGARQVADLDLLIQPGDLAAADAVLARLGFARAAQDALDRLKRCRDVLYSLERADGACLYLDLHMRLRPYGSSDRLAERILSDGMTRENLLLYLCLNLITHRWARLQPWMDLAAFLHKEVPPLDWPCVVKFAQELEWTPGVFYCLDYAAQLAGVRMPEETLSALRPGWLTHRWVGSILGPDAHAALARAGQLDGPRGTLGLLGCERGLARKLRLAAAILFPPAATLRQMDSPAANLPLATHYAQRFACKTRQLL